MRTRHRPSPSTVTDLTVVEVITAMRCLRKARSIVRATSSSSSGIMRGMYSTTVTFTPSAA